ncbi:Neutral and basic amino acid transport protein rBAT [Echinococcus granulosus]|uniref:Neutral and basic amino acid transport protein rBAT n=1 Tax=Echinococcus granulosus TaxID=6210 RepID=W6US87_ECHGR|nr:Neutral and basic amino acid transport protein rBAT [Echinococcus granulosus]EUB64133.1 Neutral and basic amino acid transport protein rBAT [Echinococcus granulosus]
MGDQALGRGDLMNTEEMTYIDGVKGDMRKVEDEYPLLTKEDLLRLDAEEPIWRRVRIALIVLFWAVWICLIVASILYIVFTPKCPPRPVQSFWQSKVGYWVNPFSFKDSNGDLVGDLKGLLSAGDYIQKSVGAGFVILTAMSPLYPKKLAAVANVSFEDIHPSLGTMDDLGALLRGFKKRGMQTVISLNFNSVPLSHELAHPAYLIPAGSVAKFCRAGNDSAELVGGKRFYSTYGMGSGVVDLNLKSPEVMEKVKGAVRFWLHRGVDGILLSDAAFFVEEGSCGTSAWMDEFPTCKLYTNGTVSVVQELRKVVDEVSSETSRQRVLIADPGNTGYGASKSEDAEKLLGTEEVPGAHLVISQQFAFNRGFVKGGEVSVKSYLDSTNASARSKMALVVASPSDKPYTSVYSTASTFLLQGELCDEWALLPFVDVRAHILAWILLNAFVIGLSAVVVGTPVIYAGSELGWSPLSTLPPPMLYPFGERPIVDDVSSHLPMPWDSHGVGFSDSEKVGTAYAAYFAGLGVVETVESALAAGRGASMFSLTTSLVQLHDEYPSLLWGSLNATVDVAKAQVDLRVWPGLQVAGVEVFKRSAVGFDSIVVAMVEAGGASSVVDFSAECSALVPLVVHPPNDAFATGVELSSLKVYFKSEVERSLYVFKCSV